MISPFSHHDIPRFASSLSHTQGTLEQIKANRELKRRKELLKDRKKSGGVGGARCQALLGFVHTMN